MSLGEFLIRLCQRKALRRRTPARSAPAKPWVEYLEERLVPADTRFAVIGDFGYAGQGEQDVASLVKSWSPDFVITTGDNNYNDGAAATIDANIGQYYHDFIGNYQGAYGTGSATNRFFPTLGNHDWHTAGAQPYLDYFTLPGNERYYDYVEGPVHFFVIDGDGNEPDGTSPTSVQGQWLKSSLAAATEPWKVVYEHFPPYSSGTDHGSSTWMQWPYQDWGANIVMSGHEHNYERLTQNGVTYFVNGLGGDEIYNDFGTPLAGSQMRYAGDYGAMLVDASATQINFQFINRSGQVIDNYTLTTSGAVPSVPAAPSGLQATAISASQINLAWADNSDNETGFKVERSADGTNFTQVATVGANATSSSDTGLAASTTYYYRVRATNASGDSPASNVARATTGDGSGGGQALTFAPVADAYVQQSSPSSNSGTSTHLYSDGSPVVESYLRFDVTGLSGAVQTAKLRLYAYGGSVDGPAVYATGGGWTEKGITWNNRPARTSGVLDDKGAVPTNSWVEYDVTTAVTGNGSYSFDLASVSDDSTDMYAREGTYPPQLVITTTSGTPVVSGPSADAGADQSAKEGSSVSFVGTASGGSAPLSYRWDFGDGSSATGTLTPSHAYDDNGTYTATLTVTDAAGLVAKDTMVVTVSNVAPTASAGGPYGGTAGSAVALGGKATDPSAADTAAGFSYAWDFGDGTTGSGASVGHTYAAAGTYTATLTATDKDGGAGSSSATVTITVGSSGSSGGGQVLTFAPVADAYVQQSSPSSNSGTSTHLYSDGSPVVESYLRFDVTGLSGAVQSAKLRLYVFNSSTDAPAVYAAGNSWTEKGITWNNRPARTSGVLDDKGAVRSGTWVEYDVTAAVTGNGSVSFDLASVASSIGLYSREGSTPPQLVITTASGTTVVSGPSADAGADQSAKEGSSVSFAGTASGGSVPLSYRWDFGDGSSATGTLTPSHAYDDNGTYTATLTVTDAAGLVARDTAVVTVSNVAPTASTGGPYSGTPGAAVALSGKATDPSAADTAAGFSYAWDFGDGTTGSGASVGHAYAATGTYTARLTVTDKDGGAGSATATVIITVGLPPAASPSLIFAAQGNGYGSTELFSSRAADFSLIRQVFNTVLVDPGDQSLVDAARAAGLNVILEFDYKWDFASGIDISAKVDAIVNQVKAHPGTVAGIHVADRLDSWANAASGRPAIDVNTMLAYLKATGGVFHQQLVGVPIYCDVEDSQLTADQPGQATSSYLFSPTSMYRYETTATLTQLYQSGYLDGFFVADNLQNWDAAVQANAWATLRAALPDPFVLVPRTSRLSFPDSVYPYDAAYADAQTKAAMLVPLQQGSNGIDLWGWHIPYSDGLRTWLNKDLSTNPLWESMKAVAASYGMAPVVVDNGDPGYSLTGSGWTSTAGTGYAGDYDAHAPGGGADTAVWQAAGLAAGSYDVLVTWVPSTGAGTNVSYAVYDGDTLLGIVRVNQQLAPTGTTINGTTFQSLGTFSIKSSTLRVVLLDDADGFVIADALAVLRL